MTWFVFYDGPAIDLIGCEENVYLFTDLQKQNYFMIKEDHIYLKYWFGNLERQMADRILRNTQMKNKFITVVI